MSPTSLVQQDQQSEEEFVTQLTLKSMMEEGHWFAKDTPDTRRLLVRSHALVPSSQGGSWSKKSAMHDVILWAGLTWKKQEGKDWECITDPAKLHTVNAGSLGGTLTQEDLNNPGTIIVHQLGEDPISSDSVKKDGSSDYFMAASNTFNKDIVKAIARSMYPDLYNILDNPVGVYETAWRGIDNC
jgi:hypothetical protein